MRVNAQKASCDSVCSEGAAAAANEVGATYCCCGDVLRLPLRQGDAVWLGLPELPTQGDEIATNPYAFGRRCPLQLPVVSLDAVGAELPLSAWYYDVTVRNG